MTTKKASSPRPQRSPRLRKEYRFDYATARPNRFAARMAEGTVAVVLDPDVARVFKTSEAVNALLRSVITSMPDQASTVRGKGR